MHKPKLIVFDLDYTLWPFYLDVHLTPPFRKTSDGSVYDRHNTRVKCFAEVPQVLEKLYQEGYTLAIASRSPETEGAKELINLLGWEKYFTYVEVYPGVKTTHFRRFHQLSSIPYSEMLFFDDEARNTTEIQNIGTTCILVHKGVSLKIIEEGLHKFALNKQK